MDHIFFSNSCGLTIWSCTLILPYYTHYSLGVKMKPLSHVHEDSILLSYYIVETLPSSMPTHMMFMPVMSVSEISEKQSSYRQHKKELVHSIWLLLHHPRSSRLPFFKLISSLPRIQPQFIPLGMTITAGNTECKESQSFWYPNLRMRKEAFC